MAIELSARRIQRQLSFIKDFQQIGNGPPVWYRVVDVISEVSERIPPGPVVITQKVGEIEVRADPLFPQVLYQLMDNAVRYGDKITTLTFIVKKMFDRMVMVCKDDCIGIPPDAKEKIFTRELYKGAGLGLFLSREIPSVNGLMIKENGEYGFRRTV